MDFFMGAELSGGLSDDTIQLIKNVEKQIKRLEKNNYGGNIHDIGIIPIIIELSPELEEQGFFKERRLVRRKQGEADYRLRIDYVKFYKLDDLRKNLLIIKNVIDSIRDIGRKVKEFNASKFEEDILALFRISYQDIEKV